MEVNSNSQISGICFSPYLEGQSPEQGINISAEQSRSRLAHFNSHVKVKAIRTYGSKSGLELIPKIASSMGIKMSAGAWLCGNRSGNEAQLESLIKTCNEDNGAHVQVAIVGNEVLLRKDLSEEDLTAYILRVRKAIPNHIMVTTAEPWGTLLKHPNIMRICDIIYVHIYSYWDQIGLDNAIQHIEHHYKNICNQVAKVNDNNKKQVVIAEIGFPSGGEAHGQAVPSAKAAATFFQRFVQWAKYNNVDFFYFSAFDEAWKVSHEGERGAHWGIMDQYGKLKEGFELGQPAPVSNASKSVSNVPPTLEMTQVPALGTTEKMAGRIVGGGNPLEYRIATYIKVGGWWTKPTFSQPLTFVNPDGTWTANVTTGGNDVNASDIAVFVVPQDYFPPKAAGEGSLSQEIFERSLAQQIIKRK